jgi:hypothetical protein
MRRMPCVAAALVFYLTAGRRRARVPIRGAWGSVADVREPAPRREPQPATWRRRGATRADARPSASHNAGVLGAAGARVSNGLQGLAHPVGCPRVAFAAAASQNISSAGSTAGASAVARGDPAQVPGCAARRRQHQPQRLRDAGEESFGRRAGRRRPCEIGEVLWVDAFAHVLTGEPPSLLKTAALRRDILSVSCARLLYGDATEPQVGREH